VLARHLSVGELVMFTSYLALFYVPINQIHSVNHMLQHALAQAAATGIGPVELCATPDATHPALRAAAAACSAALATQGTGDLGERMHRALARHLARQQRAILVGTDAPGLDASALRQAAQALDEHDAVFVPAHDGGYALVGLCRPDARLFRGLSWSHSQVMAQTRERLRATGLRWVELASVADIDEPADLVHLPPGWLEGLGGPGGAESGEAAPARRAR
jgi:rSAM/selenodomain-associated transferase 1